MNPLSLPKEIREFLGSLEHSLIEERLIPPTENINILRKVAKDILFQKIQPYYQQFKIESNTGIFNFLVEPLKNANYHGGPTQENPIRFDLILTPDVLVASYCDGGPYFTRHDVKRAYESKTPHPEKHKVELDNIGFGIGTDMIYHFSDLIHVETTTNTLFTGLLTSNKKLFTPTSKCL